MPVVVKLLRNPVYKGDYVAGKVKRKHGKAVITQKDSWIHSKEPVKELVIVDAETWDKADSNIALRDTRGKCIERTGRDEPTKPIQPIQTNDSYLLFGVAFCGHCNVKLHPKTSTSKRRLKGTGEIAVYKSKYYSCPKRLRLGICDGQYQYGIVKIEAVVLDEIYLYLENIKTIDISRLTRAYKERLLKEQTETLKPIQQKIISLRKKVAKLEEEILICLTGESVFTEKQLSEVLKTKTAALSALEQERDAVSNNIDAMSHRIDELIAFKKSAISWREEFVSANAEKQKALIGMVVDRVHISRGSIDITYKYKPNFSWQT